MQKRVPFFMIEMCKLEGAAPKAHLTIATQSTATGSLLGHFSFEPGSLERDALNRDQGSSVSFATTVA